MKTLLFTLILALSCSGLANAQSAESSEFVRMLDGNAIEFVEGEYVTGDGVLPQSAERVRHGNPNIDYTVPRGQDAEQYRSMIGHFTFNRSDIDAEAVAIHVVGMRWNFAVMVNDVEVFRNYADIADQKNAWYRPYLIPLKEDILQPGSNTISVHAFSQRSVGIGRVMVGSGAALAEHHKTRFFWHITAPMVANAIMMMLGILVLLIWSARRHETELLWLSIAAGCWFVRNYEYYADALPFDGATYTVLAICMTYFATAASAAFYIYFIKFAHRQIITAAMFAFGVLLTILFVATPLSSTVVYVPTTAVVIFVAVLAILDLLKHTSVERGVLDVTILFMPYASIYDIAILLLYQGNGQVTYLAVFCGAVFTTAFSVSFGKRVLTAFDRLGRANLVLEERIAQTRAELTESEAIRRELQVSQALTSERARLMQEMHDGIGSNLTAALAAARQQEHPPKTIAVLKRALGDLKLTVDSLEPIEGDVVALIGNLRHRMARDLATAGITCKWEVEDCDELGWLDATNALHLLRIHNEAISNVLAHSNATEMRIGCKEQAHEGQPGILTYVIDNGDGFDAEDKRLGKGSRNMQARATSLHGHLTIKSRRAYGTAIRLWLPYLR